MFYGHLPEEYSGLYAHVACHLDYSDAVIFSSFRSKRGRGTISSVVNVMWLLDCGYAR